MKTYQKIITGSAVAAIVIAASSAGAFVLLGPAWGFPVVIYDESALGNPWKNAAFNGASEWTDVTSSIFQWIPDTFGDNDVTVGSIDGSGGTLAVTSVSSISLIGFIIESDIEFDSAESWYKGTGTPSATQYDGWSVAAHEFGHALGLDHTNLSCNGSISTRPTMCPTYSKGKIYARTLHADDEDGLDALYP